MTQWSEVYADIYNTLGTTGRLTIHGRLVKEPTGVDKTLARPLTQISETEVKGAQIVLHFQGQHHPIDTDDEGYFSLTLDAEAGLTPGRHVVTITPPDDAGAALGRAWIHVMDPESRGLVLISDIDLTYLNTPFHSTSEMLQLLRDDARARVSFPGNPALYQGMREDLGDGQPTPLIFLSGSPRFFKRVIEGKLQMDDVQHDALLLKPFKAIAYRTLVRLRPHAVLRALKEQVGYKLRALLENRLGTPPGCAEILLGDDSEADFVCYNLYARLLQETLSEPELDTLLGELKVSDISRTRIMELCGKTIEHVTAERPVRFIGIRRTGAKNPRFTLDDWRMPDLVEHTDALQLALAMHQRGLIPLDLVARVRKAMLRAGLTPEELLASIDDATERGLLGDDTARLSLERVLGR